MRTPFAGLAGLALVTAATAAFAQPASTAPSGGKMTIDKTTIGDLLANPAAKTVVDKDLPGLTADPRIEQAKGMTLKDIEPYSEGKIDDAALAKVQKDLDALPGK